jgi:hypothetical protein
LIYADWAVSMLHEHGTLDTCGNIGRSHAPRTLPNYPTNAGLLQAVVRVWWLKNQALRFWMSGAEVAGNPRFIGKWPQKADDATKDAIFEALQTLAADGVVAVSNETDIEIVAPSAAQNGGVWDSLVKVADSYYSKAILGSTLLVEVGDTGGAYSLGDAQASMTIRPRVESDALAMWESIRQQLFRPFLEFNIARYGGRMPPIPVGRSVLTEDKVEVDQLLTSVGAVTIDELRQSRGLPAWGAERGGDRPVPVASAAPAVPFSTTSAEAPAAVPFPLTARPRPWDLT